VARLPHAVVTAHTIAWGTLFLAPLAWWEISLHGVVALSQGLGSTAFPGGGSLRTCLFPIPFRSDQAESWGGIGVREFVASSNPGRRPLRPG